MGELKYALYGGIITGVSVALIIGLLTNTNVENPPYDIDSDIFSDGVAKSLLASQALKKFSSYDELKSFLQEAAQRREQSVQYAYDSGRELLGSPLIPPMFAPLERSGSVEQVVPQDQVSLPEFSTTNVQVYNVDEPDFLKNDGKFVYILSNDKLTIAEVYPPESARIVAKVGLDVQGQTLQNMFLNEDRLAIFYQAYGEQLSIDEYDYRPFPVQMPKVHVVILDISNRENPKKIEDYSIDGQYNNARMIGKHVYVVANSPVDYTRPMVPLVEESSGSVIAPDVYYFDNPADYYSFNTIAAIDIFGNAINAETFMIEPTGTIYVSEDSIYVTYSKNMPYTYYKTQNRDKFFKVVNPLLPEDVQVKIKDVDESDLDPTEKWTKISDLLQETYNNMSMMERENLFRRIQKDLDQYESRIPRETQMTVIHKIGIDRLVLKYSSKAEVPGRLLNQFSMDEFDDRFRIATTSEVFTPNGSKVHNNVYVLDKNLNIVGKLEGIAPTETIYSARFMGEKLYLVTFQQIDPFFVIDLSQDTPEILGQLKIPGFSNYLHPYDEDHIMGIGRETEESKWGGVVALGIKIALFDVSNVRRPVTVDVVTIGDQTADSEVLRDHKALLFDRNKNILSIPVQFHACINQPEEVCMESKLWRGFHVFGVDPDDGFALKGKIDHKGDRYGYGYGQGGRSFYIGEVLFTVTENLIKMNDLNDMREINELRLSGSGDVINYIH